MPQKLFQRDYFLSIGKYTYCVLVNCKEFSKLADNNSLIF